jgi:hypothetical protein
MPIVAITTMVAVCVVIPLVTIAVVIAPPISLRAIIARLATGIAAVRTPRVIRVEVWPRITRIAALAAGAVGAIRLLEVAVRGYPLHVRYAVALAVVSPAHAEVAGAVSF